MITCAVCHVAQPYHRSVFGDFCRDHLFMDIDALEGVFYRRQREWAFSHYWRRMKGQRYSPYLFRIPLPDISTLYEAVR